jgi:hypothetical protein
MHDTCTYRKKKEGATKKNNKTVEGKEDYYNHKIRNKKKTMNYFCLRMFSSIYMMSNCIHEKE